VRQLSAIAVAAVCMMFSPAEGWGQANLRFVPDNAALQALPVSSATVDTPVFRAGFHAPGDGGGATYVLKNASCPLNDGKGDDGAQIWAGGKPNSGYCWLIAPPTIVDPRVWGAYGDIRRAMQMPTAIDAGSCSIALARGSFSAGDVGKKIVITDFVGNNTANGPTYAGTIESVARPDQITVAKPCPDFSTKLPQNIFWGHDDAAALNAAIRYIGTLRANQSIPTLVQLNGGGLSYGVCSAPVNITAQIDLQNIGLNALCASNMPVDTTGLLMISGPGAAYTSGSSIELDSSFLPVNAWYIAENGTTRWHHVRVFDWLGSGPGTPVTVRTSPVAAFTGSISGNTLTVSGVSHGAISPGQAVVGGRVAAGTVIQAYGNGTGGTGTYLLSAPQTLSSTALEALGNEVTVDNPAGLSQGMIAHGNGAAGIRDRSMIVAIRDRVVTLNKPPAQAMTGQRAMFYRDSNGIVLTGGAHLDSISEGQGDTAIANIPANHYGCGFLYVSGSQSDLTNSALGFGVANICMKGEARGLYVGGDTDLFQNWNRELELNPASIILMDGATNLIADRIGIFGQIQVWNVTRPVAPGLNLRNVGIGTSPSQQFAPNNWMHVYTAIPNTSARRIFIDPFGDLLTSPRPQIFFTSAGRGSWREFSTAQAAAMSKATIQALPLKGAEAGPPETAPASHE